MKQIPLTQGQFALVDDEDYDFLMQWKWCANKYHGSFYAVVSFNYYDDDSKRKCITILMHQLIMNVYGTEIHIDHKDHDTLNNQRYNLRIASRYQNNSNKTASKNGTSKYLGVAWDKDRSKWEAKICKNYKTIHLGRFEEEKLAAMAYDAKARELHGEFANLNFK